MMPSIEVVQRGRATLVTLRPAPNAPPEAEVRSCLLRVAGESKFTIVDVSSLELIDWDVIGLLLAVKKAHRTRWGTHVHYFKLVAGAGTLRKMIEALQMEQVLAPYASVEEAVASLPRRRVLHVEPDDELAAVIEILLESNGFEVVRVRAPAEVPRGEGRRFDLALTELKFAGASDPGWVRELCLEFGVPVGVLTEQPPDDLQGAEFVLRKPVALNGLMEKALEALERPLRHFYERVFDRLPTALLLVSASESQIRPNRAWLEFFQLVGGESTRRDLTSVLPGDFPGVAALSEKLVFAAHSGGEEELEIHWPADSGRGGNLHFAIAGVGFLGQEPHALVFLHPAGYPTAPESSRHQLRDAAEVRRVLFSLLEDLDRARTELRDANTRLLDLDRMKDEFVSTVSHELRTPMTAIKGSIENLLDGFVGTLEERPRHTLKLALRNAKRLARLIDNLLDLSKLEAGRLEFHRKRMDLREPVRTAVEELQSLVERSGIELGVRLPEGPAYSEIDPDRIAQVVSNLLDNALRFARSRVRITLQAAGAEARLCVEDDGPGIPADALARIFDRFGVLSGVGEKTHTGLGLSIVRSIVELQGGRVWAENAPPAEGGARFTVLLPLAGTARGQEEARTR